MRGELDDLILEACRGRDIGGLAVGILRGDERAVHGFGVADDSSGRLVTPDSIFRIASVTKVITALAVMQLVERDRLQLHDAAHRRLRAFPLHEPAPRRAPITIEHPLTHTSGIGELRRWVDAPRALLPNLLPPESRSLTAGEEQEVSPLSADSYGRPITLSPMAVKLGPK